MEIHMSESQNTIALKKFESLPTGNICDAGTKLGYPVKVMDTGIRPVDPSLRMSGYAYTVSCPGGNNLAVHQAIAQAPAGSVLVIDVHGHMGSGHIGGVMSTACQERGFTGLVIDGTCRDWDEILELKFPVFSRGANPHGNLKEKSGAINVPISCGGICVMPGDVVIGDISGVVVFSQEHAEAILKKAKEIFNNELEYVKMLRAGKTTMEIYNLPTIES
jgi:4-hydroxy-4-methyl-2-oxoglutarate aldolase